MTLQGTNSYLVVGRTEALAIDPGPADEGHRDALLAALAARALRLRAILVTHGHPDHAPGAALLHEATAAPVYAHRNARFPHDVVVGDGDVVGFDEVNVEAVDAPGHADDHLVFVLAKELLFTGDVVVGRGTVVIAPPRGDMRAYLATLRRLREKFGAARAIYGGHGEPVFDPAAKLDEYIAHRQAREGQLMAALRNGEQTIPELVARIYADVATALWPVAGRQLLAHLIALEREGTVCSRRLERPATPAERSILHPDLTALADSGCRAVAEAELGYDASGEAVVAYRLAKKVRG